MPKLNEYDPDLIWQCTLYELLSWPVACLKQLISLQSALCARGYWSPPEYESKSDILDWFKVEIQKSGLSELKETLYFAQNIGKWEVNVGAM